MELAKTASELPTARPSGLSEDVLTSAALPVAGSVRTSDVDPPPSTFNAFQTPYFSISHAAISPTFMPSLPPRASTVKSVRVRPSFDSPIVDRAVTTSYQEWSLAYLRALPGVRAASGWAASRYCGIVTAPSVTIWAEPATVVHRSTSSFTWRPSGRAGSQCTIDAWLARSMLIAGA